MPRIKRKGDKGSPCRTPLLHLKSKVGEPLTKTDVDMSQLIKGHVGLGASIRFWIEAWASDKPFKILFPDLFLLETCKSILVCHCANLQGDQIEWKWRWKRQEVEAVELLQLQQCSNLLSHIHLSSNPDRWQWLQDPSGSFSIASMRKLLHKPTANNNFTLHWNNLVPLKVNIFGWQAEKNKIATRTALQVRGIQLDSCLCRLCGD